MPALPHDVLTCPVCSSALAPDGRALVCARGHRFDAARQGYVNLLTGKGSPFEGDTPEMVDAREAFLGSGHYAPLRDAVIAASLRHAARGGIALDAGAGTGYYLQGVSEALPSHVPIALDVSKAALRRAARRLPHGISLVWDVWRRLPLADASVDVLLNVFAPRNAAEFVRVLAPNGCLVVVTPRPGHLAGLDAVGPLLSVPPQKADDVAASFAGVLAEAERTDIDYTMVLPRDLARSALVMGPAARHADRRVPGATGGATADRGLDPGSLDVDARFTLQVLTRPV
ncbi:putative RNA methyltransferase [Arthrobacter bussei]|uniref:Methyltransferase domain-containing protein n=1 Tax=Arthrobacter bussei TaxID=2594179 RepID=A0A7X1TNQ7_9MICC|nr:methyltransferase domain-containing protein [Arthrobacter bussei]MPY10840.1 methyltransferase domain-containing protein [Arthrobacter bussei]